MKKSAIFVMVFIFLTAFCFASDPAEGFWISVDEKTGKNTAGWEIYTLGNKLYGRILSVAGYPQNVKAEKCKDSYRDFPVHGKVNQMTVVGTPWIFDLTLDRAGAGNWSGGQVIDPDSGSMYKCKIIFRPRDGKKFMDDTLEMRGEIGLGIGRSQYWRKATSEEASALR